jgi:hypothetical protein
MRFARPAITENFLQLAIIAKKPFQGAKACNRIWGNSFSLCIHV